MQVIADIGKGMGDGMAHFIQHEVESVKDYDLYCFYVAGLVGHGLSKVTLSASLLLLPLTSASVRSRGGSRAVWSALPPAPA